MGERVIYKEARGEGDHWEERGGEWVRGGGLEEEEREGGKRE